MLPKPARAFLRGHETLHSTTLGWRMVNPRMPQEWTVALGESAELMADSYGISRQAQDAFALRSHTRAAAAWKNSIYDREVVPVDGTGLASDEGIRGDSTGEALASLKPVFHTDGTVTAGNSSLLNDGAAGLLLGDEAAAHRIDREPLARIAGRPGGPRSPATAGR